MTTLVIGARGAVGRHVVDQLLAAGEPVRASVRDRSTADLPPPVPVVQADLTDPGSLDAALDGVRRVFLYATVDGAQPFAAAARRSGVERVVLLSSGSVPLPWARDNPIAAEHRHVERELCDAGLPLVPVRPLVLAGNALNWADAIHAGRPVRLVHPESRSAPVHERDIAAVAVAALGGRGGDRVSDLLTGPELLTRRRQVELIGAVAGVRTRVEEITPQRARAEVGPDADAVLAFVEAGLRDGGSPMTTTAADVLGRAPSTFANWVGDHAGRFHPQEDR